jgi:predicted regulator of Ras-like GTPase activity (Roadblock/LC7/MglB family)
MVSTSTDAERLDWLISNFASRTPGVAHAIVVTADGLPLAASERLDRAMVDQLAAVTSGLASLTQGTVRLFDAGSVNQTMVEMDQGYLFVMSISDGSQLAVLAASGCNVGAVAYQMTMLVVRAGAVLTPGLRDEPQA